MSGGGPDPLAMQIVVFRATLRGEASRSAHDDLVLAARSRAESVAGFLAWRDSIDELTYWGYVLFDSADAAGEWKASARLGDVRRRASAGVYREFATHAFDAVRNSSWRLDDAPA